jgi:hypothetical protein
MIRWRSSYNKGGWMILYKLPRKQCHMSKQEAVSMVT